MRKFIPLLLIILIFYCVGCCGFAPRAYKDALQNALIAENQREYEKAYEYYKQALESRPNDKRASTKLKELGIIISQDITEKGIQAFESKKYKSALELFSKALSYDENNNKANAYNSKAAEEYKIIDEKYSKSERLRSQNKWIEAIQVLYEISESYNDDPQLGFTIDKWQDYGYTHFMKAGLEARQKAEYSQSLSFFESADSLKSDPDTKRELKKAKSYIEADRYYIKALHFFESAHFLKLDPAVQEELNAVKSYVEADEYYHRRSQQMSDNVTIFE